MIHIGVDYCLVRGYREQNDAKCRDQEQGNQVKLLAMTRLVISILNNHSGQQLSQ